jgi:uncharacterized delta-60 repeat protein
MTRRRFRPRFEPLEDRATPAAAGDLDPTFGLGGRAVTTAAGPMAVQADGKIVVALSTTGFGSGAVTVARLNPDGSPDPSFGTGGTATVPGLPSVADLAVQPDGKILLGGSSAPTGALSSNFVAERLNPNGALDTTFGTGGAVTFGFDQAVNTLHAAAVQPDGKILLAGSSERFRNLVVSTLDPAFGSIAVARLNPDGTFDPTFDGDGKATVPFPVAENNFATASDIAVQPDGKIVLGGSVLAQSTFTSPPGSRSPIRSDSYDFAAVRLTPSGQLDPAFGAGGRVQVPFDLGGGNSDKATAVGLRPDGTIVLAGSADTASGSGNTGAAARLLPNGSLDPTFDTDGKAETGGALASGGAAIRAAVAGDGSAVFAGNVAVARLNATGRADPAFGANGQVTTPFFVGSSWASGPLGLTLQPDGRILLSGTAGGAPTVARLLGSKTAGTPAPVIPGTALAGGPADGTARLLSPTGGPYTVDGTVAFFPGFTGSVRTVMADVNGDGVPDLIGGAGPGGLPGVVILDGRNLAVMDTVVAFESSFTGGVFVAAADLDGDGKAELVVTPDRGGGPVVAVYSGAMLSLGVGGDAAQLVRFFGIADSTFRGGARAALGDVNGDGTPDLVVAAGFLGGPRIALFNGKDVAAGKSDPGRLVPDFFAFEDTLRNGAFVSAGDVDGDGVADLAFGGGPGGAPRVRIFSGKALLAAGSFSNLDAVPAAQLANFFAGDSSLRGGVRVALLDPDRGGRADLVTGSGEGEPSRVRVFQSANLLANATPTADQELDPFGATLPGGVFVG